MWKFLCLTSQFLHSLMSAMLVRRFEVKSEERFLTHSSIIDWTL